MPNDNAEMKQLADNLWRYFLPRIKDATRSCLRMEKATVVSTPANGKVGIRFPFDETTLYLPFASSLASLTAGSSVWVGVPYSDLSNGIVMFDATFQNL